MDQDLRKGEEDNMNPEIKIPGLVEAFEEARLKYGKDEFGYSEVAIAGVSAMVALNRAFGNIIKTFNGGMDEYKAIEGEYHRRLGMVSESNAYKTYEGENNVLIDAWMVKGLRGKRK